MENKRILEVAEIAKGLGFKVDFDTDIETNEVIIDFTIQLSSGNSYTFYIEVSPNADAREISDQLYMYVEDFDTEVIPELEEDYEQVEIDEIKEKAYALLREHLAVREKRIGITF